MIIKSGIYAIKNILNGKMYVGSAVNIYSRWDVHLSRLNKNQHHSAHLQNAFNKQNGLGFVFGIIEEIDDVKKLVEVEQKFLELYKTYEPKYGYNMSPTAGSPLGMKHSEETKRKMSLSRSGKKQSEETRKKISNAHKGRSKSPEQIEKHRLRMLGKPSPNKGKKASIETRQKQSVAALGRKNTLEHCENISNAMRGRVRDAKHAENLSIALTGRKLSDEHKNNLSAALKGRPSPNKGQKLSEETRLKMSKARSGKIFGPRKKPYKKRKVEKKD